MNPIDTSAPWSDSTEENDAVAELSQMVRGMAGLLHTVADARYVDPSGGYLVG